MRADYRFHETTLKQFAGAFAAAFLLSTHADSAYAQNGCTSMVTTAQQAAKSAAIVVEAEITLFFHSSDKARPLDIVIEKPQTLYAVEPVKLRASMSLPVDACFTDKNLVSNLKVQNGLKGKRMRFYLVKGETADAPRFRVLFVQAVEEAPPAFPDVHKGFMPRAYQHALANALPDGWYVARSTDGQFSIDMPGTFDDVTKAEDGQTAFMLRSADRDGVTFIAVYELAGPGAKFPIAFDDASKKPGAFVSTFKGHAAVAARMQLAGPNQKLISQSMWIKAKNGIVMLGVVTPEAQEAMATKVKHRYFNSLKFE